MGAQMSKQIPLKLACHYTPRKVFPYIRGYILPQFEDHHI